LQSKSGRYGGTYAHIDIALEFASWVSVESDILNMAIFGKTAKQWRDYLS